MPAVFLLCLRLRVNTDVSLAISASLIVAFLIVSGFTQCGVEPMSCESDEDATDEEEAGVFFCDSGLDFVHTPAVVGYRHGRAGPEAV